MVSFEKRCRALVLLGDSLKRFLKGEEQRDWEPLHSLLKGQHVYNSWLIEPFILKALEDWSLRLTNESIKLLIERYPALREVNGGKKIAVVPDGNTPLAGFHDFACIILAGSHFYCNNANHGYDILEFLSRQLISIEPGMAQYIHWGAVPKDADSYFLHSKPENEKAIQTYFKGRNGLIRQKQISVGVVAPSDDHDVFVSFSQDIFPFFGLSSYNVRKLFVPRDFSVRLFLDAQEDFSYLYQYNRYANNYDYHKSVFMMDLVPFYDNGFLIFREAAELHVPIGCLYYEYYDSTEALSDKLHALTNLQMVVTNLPGFPNSAKPGKAHRFALWDYEGHSDVLAFLIDL